jgi:hypothetical protein
LTEKWTNEEYTKENLFGYSEKWWMYVNQFYETCMGSGMDYTNFGDKCSSQVMEMVRGMGWITRISAISAAVR